MSESIGNHSGKKQRNGPIELLLNVSALFVRTFASWRLRI